MIQMTRRRRWLGIAGLAAGATLAAGLATYESGPSGQQASAAECVSTPGADPSDCTSTPIKHLVVIFPENESFDHYFATYPYAVNGPGETAFTPYAGTPTGIDTELNAGLLPTSVQTAHNPNANPNVANAVTRDPNATTSSTTPNPNATQPSRLDQTTPIPGGNSHDYSDEQTRVNNGHMNQFSSNAEEYYDGNTVTALWNYAQNFAMSDNSWDATFGPSTPGALSLVSGQTYSGTAAVTGDTDGGYDDCGSGSQTMAGANIGDLLTSSDVTWGWFGGGFKPTSTYNGTTVSKSVCGATTARVGTTGTESAYSAHHTPFQYYLSTSNPHHYPGTPGVTVGANDAPNDATHTGANHQYDTSDFDAAVAAGDLPAVSFVKPPYAQDAHPGNSGPVDEASYLVRTINEIEKSPEWSSTAIIISYDDSDGWYDHEAPTVLNGSSAGSDQAVCTSVTTMINDQSGRCGPSQRLPFLVISPYAKHDYVDHTRTTQPSIIKFIENNWLGGERIDSFMEDHTSTNPYASPNGAVSYTSAALGSEDATAGDLTGMFDFSDSPGWTAILNPVTYDVSTGRCDCGTVATAVGKPVVTVGSNSVTTTAGTTPTTAQLTSMIQPSATHGEVTIDTSAVDFGAAGTYTAHVVATDYSISSDPVDVTVTVDPSGQPSDGSSPTTSPTPVTPTISVTRTSVSIPASHRATSSAAIVTRFGAILSVPGTVRADVSAIRWDVPGTYHVTITGDGGSAGAATPRTLAVRITPAVTATSLSLSSRRQTYGHGVSVVATVTGGDGNPTGTVRFTLDGRTVATRSLTGSTALVRLSRTLRVGTHRVKAAYVSNEKASAGSASGVSTLTVAPGVTLSAPARVHPGRRITVAVRVVGETRGVVRVYDGSRVIRTLHLKRGRAAFRAGWHKAGKHRLSVRYGAFRSRILTVRVSRG